MDSALIQQFIDQMHSINNIRLIPTAKNRETRYRLGITVEDQKNIIRAIEVGDYYKGPEIDRDPQRTGDVWVFKRQEYGETFYIKVKIETINEVKALSCHIDNI